jgi:aspartate ammonia-lyase
VVLADRPSFLRGLAQVKAAAAEANSTLGVIDSEVASAIVVAADEICAGQWSDQFPIPIIQGGGGTATNMAVNEVIANRAAQILGREVGRYETVHPLDDVNRSQSTNDVYPTALQIGIIKQTPALISKLISVADALERIASESGNMQRLGRTCLRDAVPLPVAAYHVAQARAVRRTASNIANATLILHEVPLGATAVGTGVGAPAEYAKKAIASLAARTELPLRPTEDRFDALAHLDGFLNVASASAAAALTLGKIAADLRLLSSGPIGGIAEISLPAVQVGSSIMPGKINPVIPELVIQASFEIRGAAHIVELAAAAGELDLNVMGPVVTRHLLGALTQLEEVAGVFADHCLTGLRWDNEVVERHLAGSLEGLVERALVVGHDAVEVNPRTSPRLGDAGNQT